MKLTASELPTVPRLKVPPFTGDRKPAVSSVKAAALKPDKVVAERIVHE